MICYNIQLKNLSDIIKIGIVDIHQPPLLGGFKLGHRNLGSFHHVFVISKFISPSYKDVGDFKNQACKR